MATDDKKREQTRQRVAAYRARRAGEGLEPTEVYLFKPEAHTIARSASARGLPVRQYIRDLLEDGMRVHGLLPINHEFRSRLHGLLTADKEPIVEAVPSIPTKRKRTRAR